MNQPKCRRRMNFQTPPPIAHKQIVADLKRSCAQGAPAAATPQRAHEVTQLFQKQDIAALQRLLSGLCDSYSGPECQHAGGTLMLGADRPAQGSPAGSPCPSERTRSRSSFSSRASHSFQTGPCLGRATLWIWLSIPTGGHGSPARVPLTGDPSHHRDPGSAQGRAALSEAGYCGCSRGAVQAGPLRARASSPTCWWKHDAESRQTCTGALRRGPQPPPRPRERTRSRSSLRPSSFSRISSMAAHPLRRHMPPCITATLLESNCCDTLSRFAHFGSPAECARDCAAPSG